MGDLTRHHIKTRRKAESNWDLSIHKGLKISKDNLEPEKIKTFTPKSPRKIDRLSFADHLDLNSSIDIAVKDNKNHSLI